MPRRIVTARFRSDAGYVLDYLEHVAGPRVAENYAARFRTTIDRIVRFPKSGSPRSALGPRARISIVAPYILIYDYDPDNDTITLLRILHEKQNITRHLIRS